MDQPLKRAAAFGPLGPATAPERALRRVLAACHDDLLKHRRVVMASRRAEGVHQTRVALRRLRAATALFRDAVAATEAREEMRVLAREAKWLAGECAPSRDLHVFLTETAADLPVTVRRVANRLARSHLQRSRDALASPRFDLFVSQLAAFVDMPAPAATGRLDAFARQALAERHRRVLRRGRKLQSFDPERLHRLRIAIKKLRYAADFLRPAFPSRPAKAYIQATTRLQGALGTLNDREVAHRMIADLEAAARPTEDIARGLRRLAKQAASGDKRRRRKLERAWQKFGKIEPFWG
ncbi:MAG: CHAD domain-containing protein [Enhydrobacter sp.]|nr:MAG: CHAD domain-containing protein [Enhydrobacter sp.]